MFLLFSNGIGPDDDEIRTGNAMILDPYGEIIAETRSAGDAMVVGNLDASLLETSSGRRWLRARRPELYESLTRRTGIEQATRKVRFGD
jgi:predicted amidohydrolase